MDYHDLRYLIKLAKEQVLDQAPRSDKQCAFVHIPKTAGTSFVHAIYNNHRQREIYPNAYELQKLNHGTYLDIHHLRANAESLLSNKTWMIGHYPIGMMKQIWPEAHYYSFFRHPTQRVISNIIHHSRHNSLYKSSTLEEIYQARKEHMTSAQARFMGYNPTKDNQMQVRQVIKSLHFIGITELYEQSISWLVKQEGWNREKSHTSKNVAAYSSDEVKHLVELIEQEQPIDKFVYDYALEEFHRRMSNIHEI